MKDRHIAYKSLLFMRPSHNRRRVPSMKRFLMYDSVLMIYVQICLAVTDFAFVWWRAMFECLCESLKHLWQVWITIGVRFWQNVLYRIWWPLWFPRCTIVRPVSSVRTQSQPKSVCWNCWISSHGHGRLQETEVQLFAAFVWKYDTQPNYSAIHTIIDESRDCLD